MENKKIGFLTISTSVLKEPCAFIMNIKPVLRTLEKIAALLVQNEIKVDTMQFMRQENEAGKLIIHCEIEKDRIAYMGRHLGKIHGVKTIYWMRTRTSEKPYYIEKTTDP